MKPRPRYFRDPVPLTASHSDTFSNPISSFSAQMSDALSSEWQKNVYYSVGDRVAFKLGSAPGVAAFECLRAHNSSYMNQPTAGGNEFWKHYPRGFPRTRTYDR